MKNIDPQAGITALLMAASSPLFGKYAIILIAALFGGLVALSRMKGFTKQDGALFIFRSVGFATALTSLAAYMLNNRYQIPEGDMLFPLAFCIALVGDGWFGIKDKLIELATRGKKNDA